MVNENMERVGGAPMDGVTFAEELLSNLRGDMSNSNFMHAFCDNSSSGSSGKEFDLKQLSLWEAALPQRIMRSLLSRGEVSERFAFPGGGKHANAASALALKRMQALVQRSREEKKDFGFDSLRIGFPLLRLKDDKSGRDLLCPLVLWKVRLEATAAGGGRYQLSREFGDVVELNDALCRYFATECDIHLKGNGPMGSQHRASQFGKYEKKDMINDVDIEVLLKRALPELNVEEVARQLAAVLKGNKGLDKVPSSSGTASSCGGNSKPKKSTVATSGSRKKGNTSGGQVVFAAVLAMFKTTNTSVLKDLEGYVRKGQLSPISQPILGPGDLCCSALPLDPSQSEAVAQLARTKNLVINGPPGTGKTKTLTALIACAGANGLRTLVVCEKKTPLEILQRNLSALRLELGVSLVGQNAARQLEAWTGDKFSCIITNVQERDDVVARAHRNRTDIERLPNADEALARRTKLVLDEIARLQGEVASEELKFARHKRINEEPVSFGLNVREAISFVIKKRLDGNLCLTLPKGVEFSDTIFAADHLMRLDRCEENLGKDTLRALRMLRIDRLVVEEDGSPRKLKRALSDQDENQHLECKLFDAEALVHAADELCTQVKAGFEQRAEVVTAAHRACIAELGRREENWANQHEDLVALRAQLQAVPQEVIQSYDAPPTRLDSLLSFFGSKDKSRLRYFHSALTRVQIEVGALGAVDKTVVIPTNFSLSNIDRLVSWCLKHRERAVESLKKARKQKPLEAWIDIISSRRSNITGGGEDGSGNSNTVSYEAEYHQCNKNILAMIECSAFSTAFALKRFTEIVCEKCETAELALLAVKKELVPFFADHLSVWRQATDSIDCLVEFGLTDNASFFGEFLDIEQLDNSSWGERIKLCVLAKEVETSCGQLITSDFVLDKLSDCHVRIQMLMQELFLLRSAGNMLTAIARYEHVSAHKFEQFYNRGSKNIRVNALREIVKDLDLFTACFPVVLCTPEVASTLFRYKRGYFDLMIVDEASQSLPHNTFCALLKAKKVVIAGDNKQMPPTTLFNVRTGNNVFDDLERLVDDVENENEDYGGNSSDTCYDKNNTLSVSLWNGRNAANAESMLDYATDHSFAFQSVDLQFHYRSANPDLMKFHCAAVYPNLALCPERALANSDDCPAIQFTHVGGMYKDQCNKAEAAAIVDILKTTLAGPEFIHPGSTRSIAVATFNEVQKNEVIKAIKTCTDHVLQQQLRALQSSKRFFVKNLENLQGDEVDVLIVSITFGPNARGGFDRRFGRITFTGIGYRYLNVLFSRAKLQVHIVSSVPQNEFVAPERTLDDTGTITGASFLWGYLSYAQAVSNGDQKRIKSILDEFALGKKVSEDRSGTGTGNGRNSINKKNSNSITCSSSTNATLPSKNSNGIIDAAMPFVTLERVVYENLVRRNDASGENRIIYEANARTLLRGIIIKLGNQRRLVIECSTYDSYEHSIYRKAILNKFGYGYYQIWPANWLDNPRREFEKLRMVISDIRRKNRSSSAGTAAAAAASTAAAQAAATPMVGDMKPILISDEGADSTSASSRATTPTLVDDSPITPPKRKNMKLLEKPFLVRYGNKRKYIVFQPEQFVRGTTDRLEGFCGSKKIKISINRLEKLKPGISSGAFVDNVEFQKASHFLQEQASPRTASTSRPSQRNKASKTSSGGRSNTHTRPTRVVDKKKKKLSQMIDDSDEELWHSANAESDDENYEEENNSEEYNLEETNMPGKSKRCRKVS